MAVAALPKTPEEHMQLSEALRYRWSLNRRAEQWVSDKRDWQFWLYLAGRGAGKTRSGAEKVREWAEKGVYQRIHLIAPTAADVRDTMVEGPAGILAVCPSWCRPLYEPSKRKLTWPTRPDGMPSTVAYLHSADKPERLRGPQCQALWADELCAWRYKEAWDMAMMGLRLPPNPRAIITTTPKPIKILLDKKNGLLHDQSCMLTRGTTYDNRANLGDPFFKHIINKYERTRLGRQELKAEILTDNPRALWKREDIDEHRVGELPKKALESIVVGVDPAVTATEDSCDTGIVVVGKDSQDPPHVYILDDRTVEMASPKTWANQAVAAYYKWQADEIVPEVNNGGDMVQYTIEVQDDTVPIHQVTASRGKRTRAEPVSMLSSQGRLHVYGTFPELEDEMCQWEPGEESPDRLDAMVWAVTRLVIEERGADFRIGRV